MTCRSHAPAAPSARLRTSQSKIVIAQSVASGARLAQAIDDRRGAVVLEACLARGRVDRHADVSTAIVGDRLAVLKQRASGKIDTPAMSTNCASNSWAASSGRIVARKAAISSTGKCGLALVGA